MELTVKNNVVRNLSFASQAIWSAMAPKVLNFTKRIQVPKRRPRTTKMIFFNVYEKKKSQSATFHRLKVLKNCFSTHPTFAMIFTYDRRPFLDYRRFHLKCISRIRQIQKRMRRLKSNAKSTIAPKCWPFFDIFPSSSNTVYRSKRLTHRTQIFTDTPYIKIGLSR